jgi:outer membrane receptor protein involved in Fe transport
MGKKKIKTFLILVICFVFNKTFSQQNFQTIIYDKVTAKPIQGATCILIQKSNRKMLGFARSNGFGRISISADTLKDTVLVWVLHKRYVEYNSLIVWTKNKYTIDTIDLIPQNKVLREVLVTGMKAITMSGDTVSYVADSFKLPMGASVEDLLKKLPGLQVAKDGTIKAMGKKVEKILIDGDDFFGDDAAAATRNLDANMIDKVEVIDAANRKSESSGSDDDKTKIINLKLKNDAKKGYFGKVEGGYTDTKRYNTTGLVNVFKQNTKLAGFLLTDNMQVRMNWQDRQELGIGDNWVYDEELDSYIEKDGDGNNTNTFNVIPQNLKTGGILSQKFSDNTGAVKANYRYNQSVYDGFQTSKNTSFVSTNTYESNTTNYINSTNKRHNLSLSLDKSIDSHQKVKFSSNIVIGGNSGYNTTDNRIDLDSVKTNASKRNNPFDFSNEKYEINGEYEYKFNKKGRFLILNSSYQYTKSEGLGYNRMNGYIYKSKLDSTAQSLDQQTSSLNINDNIRLSGRFIEPIFTKGMTLELGVSSIFSNTTSYYNNFNKNNLTNEYSVLNLSLSNNYLYNVNAWSELLKLNYKTKKIECFIGARFHQVHLRQNNLDTGKISIQRTFEYVLPNLSMIWKYRRNSSMTFSVNKFVRPPELAQLQPLVNNSNPQYIQVGNPNLKPIEQYSFSLKNNFSYPVSQSYLWASASYRMIQNDIVDSTVVSESGATKTYYTQISGNNSINLNAWSGFNIKSIGLGINPGFYLNINNRNSYLNGSTFTNQNIWSSFNLGISKTLDSILEPSINFSIDWNQSSSNNPSRPRTSNLTYKINTELQVQLPLKFEIGGELEYNINPSNAAFSGSQTYFLVTSYLQRSFLKDNSIIARFTAYDIFGQNRSINRNVSGNNINEQVSQALTRYFMLTMTYKFKNKRKNNSDEPTF